MKNAMLLTTLLCLGLLTTSAQQNQVVISVAENVNLPFTGKETRSLFPEYKNNREVKHSFVSAKPGVHSPLVVIAIPYHGSFSAADDNAADMDMTTESRLFRFQSNFINPGRKLYTYDSSEVYFLSPEIDRSNASQYQYRVLLNGKSIVQPWRDIVDFADTLFGTGNFKKGMAFFGSYKTTWDSWLQLELKCKGADSILCSATVYWKQVKPALLDIYTADQLDRFLNRLEKPRGQIVVKEGMNRWLAGYAVHELDSAGALPKKLKLGAGQGNIIFYLEGDFHEKELLEYQVIKEGSVYRDWKPNDFNNNFLWLKNLTPGEYRLQMRFAMQRHNITSYPFYIKRAWYQSTLVKTGFGALNFFILFLLFWLWKQKQKIRAEKRKKEKLNLELKVLRSQLNPHFIYNALSSIQGLNNKNDRNGVNIYLSEFSSLLRGTLKNKDAEYTPLDRELKILETYIKLEQLRFRFQYSIHVEESLAGSNIEIPSLLIQPLIENAIKHGAGPKHTDGFLKVSFSASGRNLLIVIADNGKGFTCTESSQGVGIRLVRERIQLLNDDLHRRKISISFNSNENTLTIIHLIFQNWI